MSAKVATERLWRSDDDDDRHTYRDGHPKASRLLAAEGDPIPDGYDPPKDAYEMHTEKVVATEVTDEKVEASKAIAQPETRRTRTRATRATKG